jgi:hypothetical protein
MNRKNYLDTFLSVFKTSDDYIDRNGVSHSIYCIKMCKFERFLDAAKVSMEFYFAPDYFPRIHCICKDRSSRCSNYIPSFVLDKKKVHNMVCMKTPRTFESCPIDLSPSKDSVLSKLLLDSEYSNAHKITAPQLMFSLLMFVQGIIDIFYKEPEKIIKESQSLGVKKSNKITPKEREYEIERGESVVYLSEKKYIYSDDNVGTGIKHGTHASPCEHYRRPHTRTMKKSGKVVSVSGGIINKGNERKVRYEI